MLILYHVSEKAENLRELHLALKALNKLQAPQPQSEFVAYQVEEPGIGELLKYLVIFAQIWASVSLSPEVNKSWIDRITFALGSKQYCSVPWASQRWIGSEHGHGEVIHWFDDGLDNWSSLAEIQSRSQGREVCVYTPNGESGCVYCRPRELDLKLKIS